MYKNDLQDFAKLPVDVLALIASYSCIRCIGVLVHRAESDSYDETPDSENYAGGWRTIYTCADTRQVSCTTSCMRKRITLQPIAEASNRDFALNLFRILANLCSCFDHGTLAFNFGFCDFDMVYAQLGSCRTPFGGLCIKWDGMNAREKVMWVQNLFENDACVKKRPLLKKFADAFLSSAQSNTREFPHVEAVVNNNPDSTVELGYVYMGQPVVAVNKATREASFLLKQKYNDVPGTWYIP